MVALIPSSASSFASSFASMLPLSTAPVGLLRLPSLLGPLFLTLGSWCPLLLALLALLLDSTRTLPLVLGPRASLLRSRPDHRGGSVYTFVTPMLRLGSPPRRRVLRGLSLTLDLLLPWTSRLNPFPSFPLSGRGPSLFYPRLNMLADYPVAWLVPVIAVAQRTLLIHRRRIPIPCIAALVDGERGARRS